jgi:sucrose-6-phosphate hydrolase SacC (GH32 family)
MNTTLIMNWDLPGWDYYFVPNITQWSDCQVACYHDNRCQSWTFDISRKINDNCFLKSGIPLLVSKSVSISGVKQRENNQQPVWIYIDRTLSQSNPSAGRYPFFGVIWMESSGSNNSLSLELDIFVDHSVIEVFESQEGRIAITGRAYPEEENAQVVAAYALHVPMNNDSIIIKTLDYWTLNTIWT